MLGYIIIAIGGLWGALTLIGYAFSDAKCVNCGYYVPKEYMISVSYKKYKHIGC